MGQLLPRHPGADLAGQLWRQVARHATLARHDWDAADPATRPTAAGAWTVISRIAGLAEATALLDRDLATSAVAAGRAETAQDLTGGAWSGVAGAAAAVQQLAARGQLPEVADVTLRTSQRLVPVRALTDLPAATQRLASLVTTAVALSPTDLGQVTRAHARVAMTAARLLDAALPHPAPRDRLDVVEALADHAQHLARAAGRPARAATIHPSDPRPLAQASEILRFLATTAPRSLPRPGGTPPR